MNMEDACVYLILHLFQVLLRQHVALIMCVIETGRLTLLPEEDDDWLLTLQTSDHVTEQTFVMLLLVTLVRVSNLCTVGKWWSGLVSRVWSIWDKSILSVIVLNIKQTITKLGVCLSGKSIYHVSTQSWVLIFYTSKWIWKTIMCLSFSLQLCQEKGDYLIILIAIRLLWWCKCL